MVALYVYLFYLILNYLNILKENSLDIALVEYKTRKDCMTQDH